MSYTPLNRIQTNLFTAGGEYYVLSTKQIYQGYYYRLYNGKIFTGKTPDDYQTAELAVYNSNEIQNLNTNPQQLLKQSVTALDTEVILPGISTYLTIVGTPIENPPVLKAPTTYFPQPTPQQYQVGEFLRYFAKKTNELLYIEITKETYVSLKSQDSGYAWQFYLPFQLPWQISGDKMMVAKTNRNMVLLTEQRLKIKGLQQFLQEDYTKFYKK
jgi:hypothetical protein